MKTTFPGFFVFAWLVIGCERPVPFVSDGGPVEVQDGGVTNAGPRDGGEDGGGGDAGLGDGGASVDAGPGLDAGRPGVPDPAQSSLVATALAVADGVDEAVVVISIKDVFGTGVAGVTPVLSIGGTGNLTRPCTPTLASGVSTCGVRSTVAEPKALTTSSPVVLTGATRFVAGPPADATSTFDGGPTTLPADGTSEGLVSVRLSDAFGNPVEGVTPTLTLTGLAAQLAPPAPTNAQGVSTTRVRSTIPGTAMVALTAPLQRGPLAFTFVAGAPSESRSTISATPGSAPADGVSAVQLTATIRDAQGNPLPGQTVRFAVPDAGLVLEQPALLTSDAGVAQGRLFGVLPGVRLVTLAQPLVTSTGATVTFTPNVPDPAQCSLVASPTTAIADGMAAIEVLVTLRDSSARPVAGVGVVVASTRGTVTQGPPTDLQGQTRAFVRSTTGGPAVITVTSPVVLGSEFVTFRPILDVEVPLEMLSWPVNWSSGAALQVDRSQLHLDRSDYDGVVTTTFEAVCQGAQRTVELVAQSSGAAVASVSCPAAASPTRVRSTAFTWSGAQVFRARLAAASTAAPFVLHSARVIVTQTAATRTRYMALLVRGPNTAQGEAISTTFNSSEFASQLVSWWWSPTRVAGLSPSTPFEFEVIADISGTSISPTVRLRREELFFDAATVSTAPGLRRYTTAFAAPPGGGPSQNTEARYRVSPGGASNGWFLLRAAVWVRLENMERLQLQIPLTGGPEAHDPALHRFELTRYTNPTTSLLANTSIPGFPGNTATVQLQGSAGDTVTGSMALGPPLSAQGPSSLAVPAASLDQLRLSATVQGTSVQAPLLRVEVN
ncbi:MAG: Ig-like domain-containing protein [Myxococcaceae bacterium]|nr:Ig-like domain-containing protein [Myxococcaceae bacterium]